MKKLLITVIMAGLSFSQAQSISFGKIESPEKFQKHWGLTKEQMTEYEDYMKVAGKYRHQSSNPLVVLSIISADPEDKGFYASKAAAYEHKMAKAEIETAWLITQEMELQGLDEAMQSFSDELTGVDTKSYSPQSVKVSWMKKDKAILVINKTCLSASCINGFLPLFNNIPNTIAVEKEIILKDKKPLSSEVKKVLAKNIGISLKNYDPIEHKYLDNFVNQVIQVRDNKVVRKF